MKIKNKLYNLTPKTEFYLIGYGDRFESRREPAKGIHDEIFVNVLMIEIDGEKIFIFNADYIEFLEDFCNDMKDELVKRYSIKRNNIFFSATHNHQSVRDYHKTWATGKYNKEYEDFLIKTIYQCFEECSEDMMDVEARFGTNVITGYYGNRNHLGELADNEVIKVEFVKDGNVVAGIINWAVHSTVLSPKNDMLTAEFAGNVREYFAEIAGYKPLMIVGAAGDCSTRTLSQGNDFAELERVSRAMANEINNIVADIPLNIKYVFSKYIGYRIQYSMKEHYNEIREKICEYEYFMKEQSATKTNISPAFYIKCLKKKLDIDSVDINLFSSIINIGDLTIITIPGELGSKFGIELKKLSASKCTLIFGYTNGFLHYMMPKEEYGLSMETIDSLYPQGSIEKYIEKIKEVLVEE